jgi:hypothetical protein
MRQPIDNWVPTRGGLVEHWDRVAAPPNMVGTEYLFENSPYRVFPKAVDLVDLRRHTVSLLMLGPYTGMRSLSPRPHG